MLATFDPSVNRLGEFISHHSAKKKLRYMYALRKSLQKERTKCKTKKLDRKYSKRSKKGWRGSHGFDKFIFYIFCFHHKLCLVLYLCYIFSFFNDEIHRLHLSSIVQIFTCPILHITFGKRCLNNENIRKSNIPFFRLWRTHTFYTWQ